jgi:hypothetical protein
MATEWLDPTEAFEEGEKERIERLRKKAIPVVTLKLVGGPQHGGEYRVPMDLVMRGRNFEIPVRVEQDRSVIVRPGGRPLHAVYRLDRSQMVMRYTHTDAY